MQIGISGISGQLGKSTVNELVARGGEHKIVGISRTPTGLPTSVETREGDYNKPEALVAAYKGLDRLLLIPSSELLDGVRGRQMRDAIDAAVKAGVGHIILVSSIGTKEAFIPENMEAYWTAEQHLIRTAPRWTIIRMNYYMESLIDELKTNVEQGAVAGFGEERVAYISRNDLAAMAAGVLTTDGHSGAIYNATGPEIITGEDKVALLSEAVGKPISFVVVSEADLRAGLTQAGLPDFIVNVLIEIKHSFVAGKFDIVTGDVERLTGRKPQTLRASLAKAFA